MNDTCLPVNCDDGETPVDTGTNGVADTCTAATPVTCATGQTAIDTNGDGVADKCTANEVLPNNVTRTPARRQPGTLPHTGGDPVPLAAVGAMILLLGRRVPPQLQGAAGS